MTFMVLWRAINKPTLFESEEYESYKEAAKAALDFHTKFPWNTYLVVHIETVFAGIGKTPHPLGESTFPEPE